MHKKGEVAIMEYRLARAEEKEKIVAFMDAYWGSQHPILHREEYFNYYFCTGNEINFAIAVEDEKILAVCGFTPCNKEGDEIWISLWQAAKKKNGVGLELMSKMLELTGAKRMSCNNIREETQVFYQFLGYETGELHQYYRLGERKEYHLAKLENTIRLPVCDDILYEKLGCFEEIAQNCGFLKGENPRKDLWYLKKRFFDFPGYQYELYGMKEDGLITALFALRVNPVGSETVLRLVDYWGSAENFEKIGGTIDVLLTQYDAEYCDMYCVGIPLESVKIAGFTLRERDSATVIPNYLNPPVEFNTDYFYFTSEASGFRMFKADGDQDRPNLG